MKSMKNFFKIHQNRFVLSRKFFFDVHPEVRSAINERRPVVACETAILTHGLPRPINVETCAQVERIIRENGSTPATIAVLDGRIKVGLSESELERLGNSENVMKVSRRDLVRLLSSGGSGGTTVAATMLIAHRCGIKIFATGGIGGVHRDFSESGDVSSDLDELGRTPICVVSSGVKSILDVPRTLEYLETKGVAVFTFGENDDFPNFFTRKNEFGSKSNGAIKSIDEASKIVETMIKLKLDSAVLIAVPIDVEDEFKAKNFESIIQNSLRVAAEKSISGHRVTPFVLAELRRQTDDQTIRTNQKLIYKNAKIASQIAENLFSNKEKNSSLTVIGARNVDIHVQLDSDFKLNQGSTLPCRIRQSLGGVAYNVTYALNLLKTPSVRLLTVGGEETPLERKDSTSILIERFSDENTASYISILDSRSNELLCGLGEMEIYERKIDDKFIEKNRSLLMKSEWILFDANLTENAMRKVVEIGEEYRKFLLFICAGGPRKAERIRPFLRSISVIFCNRSEFESIVGKSDSIEKSLSKFLKENPNLKLVSVTMSADGVLIGENGKIKRFRPLKLAEKRNVTGAGDSFAAGLLSHLLKFGWENVDRAVGLGLLAAKLTLSSSKTVSEKLETIDEKIIDEIFANELQIELIENF